jgi:hypothetical protein
MTALPNNDQDQPVAATDIPMCAQPIGNVAVHFAVKTGVL